MNRILLTAAAFTALATSAIAQEARHAPPNPDIDHDGKVTLAEFKTMQAERQTRLFARLDADHDGRITQAEADAGAKAGEARGRGRRGGRGGLLMRLDADRDGAVTAAEMSARTEGRFHTADTNKDGWLSAEELSMMRQRRGPGGA